MGTGGPCSLERGGSFLHGFGSNGTDQNGGANDDRKTCGTDDDRKTCNDVQTDGRKNRNDGFQTDRRKSCETNGCQSSGDHGCESNHGLRDGCGAGPDKRSQGSIGSGDAAPPDGPDGEPPDSAGVANGGWSRKEFAMIADRVRYGVWQVDTSRPESCGADNG